MKGSIAIENSDPGDDFIFKSIIYDQNYQITLAMSTNSSKFCIFVIGDNDNSSSFITR